MDDYLMTLLENFAETCEKTVDFKRSDYHSLRVISASDEYDTPAARANKAMTGSFPILMYQFSGSLIYVNDIYTRDNEKYFLICFDCSYQTQYINLAQKKMKSKTTYQFNTNTQMNINDTTDMRNFECFIGFTPGSFQHRVINGRVYIIHAFRGIKGIIEYKETTVSAQSGRYEFSIGDIFDVDANYDVKAKF